MGKGGARGKTPSFDRNAAKKIAARQQRIAQKRNEAKLSKVFGKLGKKAEQN